MREVLLVIHFLGLAMAVGSGFSNLFLGYAGSKLAPAERGPFMSKLMILMPMGRIGLLLLVLSGLLLMTPHWELLSRMPFLIAKLIVVGLLLINVTLVMILVNKARKEGNPAKISQLRPVGMINFALGILIIILAVRAFE